MAAIYLLGVAEVFSQPVVWSGNGDGASWNNSQNWVGNQVPGPGNSVFITNGIGGTVVISASVTVESVVCNKGLTITNNVLTVTLGVSSIQGTLTVGTSGGLAASGSATTFTSTGPVVGADGNFAVSGGAVMILPGLQNYTKACNGANWTATGSNSVLNLPGLTNITGAACNFPVIKASAGGHIFATNLFSIEAGPLAFQADGSNSLINIGALSSCSGQSPYLVTFESSAGGTLIASNMSGGPFVGVTINTNATLQTAPLGELTSLTVNGGTVTLPALTNMSGGLVAAVGAAVSLPALTNIDDGNFNLSVGASVTAAALPSYGKSCNGANWTVTGTNTLLNLPALTNMTGNPCNYPFIQAEAGGHILMTKLANIQAGPLAFQADGGGSFINMSALTSCAGQSPYLVTFEASAGGDLQVPNMSGGPFVGVTLNTNGTLQTAPLGQLASLTVPGGTSVFPALTNMSGGLITASGGAALSFPALVNINDGNFNISAGSSVTAPALVNYTKSCNGANWIVTGSNSVLSLPVLANITGAECGFPTIQAEAGGQILAANLAAIQAGPLAFQADGSNSLINLTGLITCNGQGPYLVTFETSTGGTLEIPNMTGGSLVGVTINSNSTMQVGKIGELNSITINGGTVTFASLTNISGGTIIVNGGTANFPALTSFDGGNGSSIQANGGATVSIPQLSTLEGVNITLSSSNMLNLNAVTNLSGSVLTVNGISVTLASAANIQNASFYVNSGGSLSIPAVRNCSNTAAVTWLASGAGSGLALTGLTNLVGPYNFYNSGTALFIQAQSGGGVNLNGLASISSGIVEFQSSGAGSQINLSALQQFDGTYVYSLLQPSGGGAILTGQLQDMIGVTAWLGGGAMNLAAVTNMSDSTLVVTNGSVTLTNVANIYDASLYVSSGATLSLPSVTSCNDDNTATWQANGPGSVLALTGLANLACPYNFYNPSEGLYIQAQSGGLVNLDGLSAISAGIAFVQSSGSGSEINLSALQNFDSAYTYSQLQTSSGGVILAGQLGSMNMVTAVLGNGTLNLHSVTNMSGSILTLTNGALTLPNLVNINDASLYVSSGATLSLPSVTACNDDGTQTWQASGPGSVLALTGLANLACPYNFYNPSEALYIQAQNGGLINLDGLLAITAGIANVQSSGAGSEVNISALQQFDSSFVYSLLQPSSGGTILAGNLSSVNMVAVDIGGGTLNLNGVTNLSGTVLTITNGSLTLPNVANIDDASFYVSNGATLSLPNVLNCTNDSPATWQASGLGSVLSLTGLTNLAGPYNFYNSGVALFVQAQAGGLVNLNGLDSISTGIADFQSSGAGSEINLSALRQFDSSFVYSRLQPSGGATILTGQLGSMTSVTVVLGGGALNLNTVTNLSSSSVTVTNGSVTLSNAVNITDTSLYAGNGAALSLPKVVACTEDAPATWQAAGAGSTLAMTALTNLACPFYVYNSGIALFVQALSGGYVNLDGLDSISTGIADVEASGSGSEVNFSSLQQFDSSYIYSQLLPVNGGVILAGQLGSVTAVSATLGGGTINLSTVTNLDASVLTMTNGALTLGNVTDINDASFYVTNGATLSLPSVQSCVESAQSTVVWQASGAGSVLNLTGLTNVVAPYNQFNSGEALYIQALAGGQVNLYQLLSIASGATQLEASGADSVVNVTRLINYVPGTTTLTTAGGGVIVRAQPLLLVTANNASMTYGGTVPVLSVNYAGFTNTDTSNSLTVQPSISTTATSLSHPGAYPITVSGAVDANYTIVFVPGTLTINPAPLSITASNETKVYGQLAALPSTAFSVSGLLNGDAIAGITLTSAGAVSNAAVGNYALSATNATGPRAANYNITYHAGTLAVAKAPLAITANNQSKYFGKTLVFNGTAFTASGLQNGERVGSVTLTSAGAISSATVAGSPYPIIPSAAAGGTFAAGNYSISYVNGSLTVVPTGAAPAISSVAPGAAPVNGGTAITINGANFEQGATVNFGALPATLVTFVSPGVLTAVTPVSASGTVGVTVINPDGNSITASAALAFGNGPVIVTGPASLALSPGQSAHFAVTATGDATLAYQWQFNGANLANNGRIAGVTTAALTIGNSTVADDGYYRCVVTNLYASATSASAMLSVVAPPSLVTVSPPSVSVGQGGSATLAATNGGTGPFGYAWYQNGVLVPGQTTSVFNIASAQASASYTVVVSNVSGMATSAPVALTLLGYCMNGQPTQLTYPEGTNFIPINVTTYNCGTQTPAPNAAGVVWLSIDGTTRNLAVTTDGSGNGVAYFTPLPVEVGLVKYGFALPGQGEPAYTGSFTIIGMNLSAQSESPQLVVGAPQTNTLLLNNLTPVPLTGITAAVLGAPGNVNVQVSVPSVVTSNGAIQTAYILEATSVGQGQAQFSIQYTSAQGATVTLPFTATISPPTAQLAAAPPSLVAAMINGTQTLVTFTLTNFGGAASGPLQIDLPPASWLSLSTAQPIPSLGVNQSGQIMLSLTPTNGQTLGEYTGSLVIQGSNTSLTVPFTFTDVSTMKGNLQVTAQDELTIYGANQPNLSNATVSVSDLLTGSNIATQVTGASGTVTFSNLTSAYYNIAVTAPDHGNFNTTLLLAANATTPVTAFLPLNLVDYTWTVIPTSIPDTYDFTLTTIFVTEVPWPEITVNPIDLCTLPNCTNQYDLVINNSGLIAAEGLQIVINNSNPYWSFTTLVTNLGNLAAESSITVPITLTRLGCATNIGGPTSIDASLNWYVAALNGTKYYSTPIFIYNANCVPGNGGSPPVGPARGGGSGVAGYSSPISYTYTPVPGAVVNVTLQIDQTAVLTANAFHATLSLTNGAASPITDLQVVLNPVYTNGNPATNAFFVQQPLLYGVNAVDGSGSLAPGAGGQADWTVIPTTNAAPVGTSNYAIGGSISYVYEGQQVIIPLFPVPISVLPEPQLNLDYFLQHDVYSQDPFTSVFEPPIPFALGLRVRNTGFGVADNFTITSAQPVIINNANGLLINFQIISSDVGTNTIPVPSLTLNMGNIDPGANVVGIWEMTSSLEGDFTNFQATFQHLDSLGGQQTSLVNSVRIHEMTHVVEITCPGDDHIADFLCNDTTNVDALPDDVYSSDGNVYPVTSLTGAVAAGTVSRINSTITISDVADNISSGFVYFQLVDPSGGQYAITGVKRSDGTELFVGTNVWQTPVRPHMVPPQLNNLIHIFDCDSTGSYTVAYGPAIAAPQVTTLAAENVTPTNATLSGVINPESGATEYYFEWGLTATYGDFTPTNSLTANLGSPQAVTAFINSLAPTTAVHYQLVAINAIGTNFGGDQTLKTSALPLPVIAPVPNQMAIVGRNIVITNIAVVATPPVTFTLGGTVPAGASISTNGVFTWTPDCPQGSTTNIITVWAADSGTPQLSNSTTFQIVVGECVQLGIGSAVVPVGQTGSVPVTLFSTVGITNLSFALNVPANRLANYTISPSNSAIASASVQAASDAPVFTLVTRPGQTLPSPSLLGSIGFKALAGDSIFLPVTATNIIGLQTGGIGVGNVTSLPGQVTIVGFHPLLAPALSSNGTIILTLFGTPGSNYVMAFTTNLALTNWQTGSTILLTNIQQNISLPITGPHTYFRLQ